MAPKMNAASSEEEVLEVFKPYDSNGKGLITETNLREIIKTLLGEGLQDEELDEIIRGEANVDSNNMVDYKAFVKILIAGGGLKEIRG